MSTTESERAVSDDLGHLRLPADATSVGAARRFVAEQLASLDDEQLDAVVLVTSELVSNVVCHDRGSIDVEIERIRDRVRVHVEVRPSASSPAAELTDRVPGLDAVVIDAVSAAWGARSTSTGTTDIWAEIRTNR